MQWIFIKFNLHIVLIGEIERVQIEIRIHKFIWFGKFKSLKE